MFAFSGARQKNPFDPSDTTYLSQIPHLSIPVYGAHGTYMGHAWSKSLTLENKLYIPMSLWIV